LFSVYWVASIAVEFLATAPPSGEELYRSLAKMSAGYVLTAIYGLAYAATLGRQGFRLIPVVLWCYGLGLAGVHALPKQWSTFVE